MVTRFILRHFAAALAIAVLSSVAVTSVGFAQSASPSSGPFILRIETPQPDAQVNGTLTVTGAAVDCSGQAATRVAVFRGTGTSAADYLADVSMETNREFSAFCAVGSSANSSGKLGFRLMLDSNRLGEGHQMLNLVAHFGSGASEVTRSTTLGLNVRNTGYEVRDGYYGWRNGYWSGAVYPGYWSRPVYRGYWSGPLYSGYRSGAVYSPRYCGSGNVQVFNAPHAGYPITMWNGQVVYAPSAGFPYTVVNGRVMTAGYPNGAVGDPYYISQIC